MDGDVIAGTKVIAEGAASASGTQGDAGGGFKRGSESDGVVPLVLDGAAGCGQELAARAAATPFLGVGVLDLNGSGEAEVGDGFDGEAGSQARTGEGWEMVEAFGHAKEPGPNSGGCSKPTAKTWARSEAGRVARGRSGESSSQTTPPVPDFFNTVLKTF